MNTRTVISLRIDPVILRVLTDLATHRECGVAELTEQIISQKLQAEGALHAGYKLPRRGRRGRPPKNLKVAS